MRIVIQADPIESFVTPTDSSFALMLEAQSRGHEIWVCEPKDLYFVEGNLNLFARYINVVDAMTEFFSVIRSETLLVRQCDVILVRQDPPFDMSYLANTLMLDVAEQNTLVLNAPSSLRNVSEKLSTIQLAKYMPPTFIGYNREEICKFASKHGEVVIKPLFLSGGRMIFRSKSDDDNLLKYVEAVASAEHGLVIVQKYLPGVMDKDKRVVFLEGEPVAVLGRRPKEGEFRANIHAGGEAVSADLTKAERLMCADIAEFLVEKEVFLAGVDLIDGYLTEINVTSPTLMREIKAIGGPDVPKMFWDRVERKVGERSGKS
jgi:glutathione synthase